MTMCPFCGDENADYIGVEIDWDYDCVALVDLYRCLSCGADFELYNQSWLDGVNDETKPSHDHAG